MKEFSRDFVTALISVVIFTVVMVIHLALVETGQTEIAEKFMAGIFAFFMYGFINYVRKETKD